MNRAAGVLPVATAAVVVLGLLLAAPAASAQEMMSAAVRLEFTDVENLDVAVEVEYPGEEARMQRAYMDADDDGTVTEDEVQAQADRQLQQVRTARFGLPLGRLYLDGRENTNSSVVAITSAGAAGPTDSNASLAMTWHFAIGWSENASAHQGSHLFEIDTANHTVGGYLRVQTSFALLKAPDGFAIGDTGGLPFGAKVEDRRILMPTGTSGAGWIRVAFVPASEQDSPPASSAWLLVALAALAVAWRRLP